MAESSRSEAPGGGRVFLVGPQVTRWTRDRLSRLQRTLREEARFAFLVRALAKLPDLQPELQKIGAADRVADQLEALRSFALGEATLDGQGLTNCQMAPLTVTSQVVDWTCKRASARPWLEHGLGDVVAVQGLGVGFLLAAVLSTARAEEQYESSVCNSVRLAACVGVVVDAGAGALPPWARITAVSMRCRTASDRASLDACLDRFPEANVSCIYDAGALTATLPYRSLEGLMELVDSEGVQVCHIGSSCIFHDARNRHAAEKLKRVCAEHGDLGLPGAESLRLPLRSTADARVITCGNMSDAAIDVILSSRAHWFQTIKRTVAASAPGFAKLESIGLEPCVPLSLTPHKVGSKDHVPPKTESPPMDPVAMASKTGAITHWLAGDDGKVV